MKVENNTVVKLSENETPTEVLAQQVKLEVKERFDEFQRFLAENELRVEMSFEVKTYSDKHYELLIALVQKGNAVEMPEQLILVKLHQ